MPKKPLEAIEEYFSKVTDLRTPALSKDFGTMWRAVPGRIEPKTTN